MLYLAMNEQIAATQQYFCRQRSDCFHSWPMTCSSQCCQLYRLACKPRWIGPSIPLLRLRGSYSVGITLAPLGAVCLGFKSVLGGRRACPPMAQWLQICIKLLYWYTNDLQPVLFSGVCWVRFKRIVTKRSRRDFGRQVSHIRRQVAPSNEKCIRPCLVSRCAVGREMQPNVTCSVETTKPTG